MKIAGMITHYIQYKHKEIMVPFFKSLVRPILEYGNTVWAHCLIKNITHIENRRFTKTSYWQQPKTNGTELPSLEYRKARGDMIETFKITHGYYDHETVCSLFTLYESAGIF